jgi:hypothetical protein
MVKKLIKTQVAEVLSTTKNLFIIIMRKKIIIIFKETK